MKLRLWLFIGLMSGLTCLVGWRAVPGLTAGTDLAPSLWVTPLVLDFGPIGLDDTAGPFTVTLHNVGTAELTGFAGGGVDAPFSAAQNCAGGVPPGGSCQYFFSFSPTEVGTFTAVSSSGVNAGSFSIELRGEGVGPRLHVSQSSLDFGRIFVSGTSPQQTATIHNTGLAELAGFAGGGVDAPFSAAQNCAGGVPPGGSCQYFFSFSPTTTGIFTDTSSSGSNGGSFSIDLRGRGVTILGPSQQVTPQALNFGPVGVGFSSETLIVEVINQSPATTITNFAGGGVSPPFGAAQNCAGGVPPGDTCQFFYTFDPTETGVFSTTSNVSTSLGSFSIALQGEGMGAGLSVSPLVLDFGYTAPGEMQVVTVVNTGMAALDGFAGGGVNPPFSAAQNCAGGVPPGDSCQFFYEFNPTELGAFTTTSNVSTNAGSFSILLRGGVTAPGLTQSFLPAHISPGETATLQYMIHNPNTAVTLFAAEVSNTFPDGLVVADPLSFSASAACGTPDFAPTVGATAVIFENATILGGDDCVVQVDVTAAEIGIYTNTTDPVSSLYSGAGSTATAALQVGGILYLPFMVR